MFLIKQFSQETLHERAPWHPASPKMDAFFCFLQEVNFRFLPCTANHISFLDRGEERQNTT
jgi:hypothetical protein